MGDQFGSFGALSPDKMSAIKEAMSRRGMGDSVPALNQQSAMSATPAPPAPDMSGGVAPTPGGDMGAVAPEQQLGTPVGAPEAELIIKALQQRLSSISKVDQAQAGIQ